MGLSRMRLLGGSGQREEGLARAERQQHFLANPVFELLEVERGLTLVAENLDDRGFAFVVHFNTRVVQTDDVHL